VGLARYRTEVSMLLGRYRELSRTTAAAKSLRRFNPRTSPAELLAMARVLVIEDDGSISQLLRMIFESDGHEVLVAEDGSRGLATATRRNPDVIVLDIMMPFMDGFAVLEALREDERTVSTPVLMLSANQTEAVEERCYRLGAQGFMRKPFDPGILLGTVKDLVTAPPLRVEQVVREQRDMPLSVILAWRGGTEP